jgi:hypothetical protein
MGRLRHKTRYAIVLAHEQLAALRNLSAETKLPLQVLLRDGANLVLRKYGKVRPG